MIFISHSSKDIGLVKALNDFLIAIGLKQDFIFCSSINGQGVQNGQRISNQIQNAIQKSDVLIYVVTQNFLASTYCTNELGAGWILNGSKSIFLFKSEDVNFEDLKGFINDQYKYSSFDSNGMAELYDVLDEKYSLPLKHSLVNSAINSFLEKAKIETSILVERKDMSSKEIEEKQISALEGQYKHLAPGAKRIIAEIYFSYEGVRYFSVTNGAVGSLEQKLFIHRTTSMSTGFLKFAYELQPWVINFIDKNKSVKKELEKLIKDEDAVIPTEPWL